MMAKQVVITAGSIRNTFIGPNEQRIVEHTDAIKNMVRGGFVIALCDVDETPPETTPEPAPAREPRPRGKRRAPDPQEPPQAGVVIPEIETAFVESTSALVADAARSAPDAAPDLTDARADAEGDRDG